MKIIGSKIFIFNNRYLNYIIRHLFYSVNLRESNEANCIILTAVARGISQHYRSVIIFKKQPSSDEGGWLGQDMHGLGI